MRNDLVLVRGGGRTGTAIAHRLRLCGFPVVVTEAMRPTLIHRRLAFGSAIYESSLIVVGVPARRVADAGGIRQVLESGAVPVLADPPAVVREALRPWVLVDAIGLDRNVGTRLTDAPIVIGVGEGFTAGRDVHVVVDSRPAQGLGSFTYEGPLDRDVLPGPFSGILPVPLTSHGVGRFEPRVAFGQVVAAGDVLAHAGGVPVTAPHAGIVSGLIAEGLFVGPGMRLAEVDPRTDAAVLEAIDPRARAIAGGVLEAILYTAAVGSEPGQALNLAIDPGGAAAARPGGDPSPGGPGVAPQPAGK